METKIIAIAGGSGVGKSTLCYELVDQYPELFTIIHLDDYQKLKTEKNLPMHGDKINWDHPDVINWDLLRNDIGKLKQGQEVIVSSWSHRDNVDYNSHGNIMDVKVSPRPFILVEGYLALYKEVSYIYDKKIFLDLDHETRTQRRGKFMDSVYEKEVLIPMHNQFVEPTKDIADIVLDVSSLSQLEVFDFISRKILEK